MEFAHLCLLRAGLTLQPPEGLSHCSVPCIHAVCHPLGDCGYMWVELAGGIRGMSRQSHDSLPGSSGAQRWVRDRAESMAWVWAMLASRDSSNHSFMVFLVCFQLLSALLSRAVLSTAKAHY